MVADAGLGWAYTVAVNLTDSNGSPISGAPSLGGTLNVYGPGSATTIVATGTAGDLGGGDYGIVVPGTATGTAGYYRWSISTITVGGYTFTNLTGGFAVGDIPPEYRTLRAILVAVCEALGVGVASTTTALGSTTTIKDTRWYDTGLASNEMVDDELVILEPGAATDPRPLRVSASDHTTGSTGTLTFAPPVGSAVASGTDYLLIRAGSGGLRYAQIIEAIVAAVADLATRQRVTDRVTLTTTGQQREYTLPSGWLKPEKVELAYQPVNVDPVWQEVMPSLWEWNPDRRTFALAWEPGEVFLIRLTGKVGVPEPRLLSGLVKVPWTLARDAAVGYLSLSAQQRGGLAYGRARSAMLGSGWR